METWNYEVPKVVSFYQQDWNQTLITVLNFMKNKYDLPNPTKVRVPKKLMRLVESLEYYKYGIIGANFIVEVIDENSTVMNVGGIDLMIENYD